MITQINQRGFIAYVHDVFMAGVSFWVSFYLRVGDNWHLYRDDERLIIAAVALTFISATVFMPSGLYKGIWRYASIADLLAITKAVTLVILLFSFVMFLWTRLETFPRSILIINWFVMMILLGSPRFVYRLLKDYRFDKFSSKEVPVLLIGAGDQTELFIRSLHRLREMPYRIIGIIAENQNRLGREIHGIPVLGVIKNLAPLVKSFSQEDRPQRLILTKSNIDGALISSLLDTATELGMTLARAPQITELTTNMSKILEVRPIAIEDLLGRVQKPLDRDSMRELVMGRRVLITGAGGSIGSELARQISDFEPKSLALLDQSEFALYSIDLELEKRWPNLKRVSIIGDIRDGKRVKSIFSSFAPELVFHAAALKHVPLVESNIFEGIFTNVIGTANVANACSEFKVNAMVMVSTDKAINPSSIMGASKRLAEIYCQALDVEGGSNSQTRYITVRFGNVLGSAGSVVPLFQKQLIDGGPLTITHPDMTRYFMTISEAVELVLQASALGRTERRGKIYVLDMGEPVKIMDLAIQMIRLAGLNPGKDVEIKVIGTRPGEKMFEELLHKEENIIATASEGILLANPRIVHMNKIVKAISDLREVCAKAEKERLMSIIQNFIPEYCGNDIINYKIKK